MDQGSGATWSLLPKSRWRNPNSPSYIASAQASPRRPKCPST
jgi:hypothetical protein